MKIRIGQVFRVEHPGTRSEGVALDGFPSYYELTCGAYNVGADINRGGIGFEGASPLQATPAQL